MKALLAISFISLATVANAGPTILTFSGPSASGQPTKVSLVEQEAGKYRLLQTVFKHHPQTGLSYQTRGLASDLDCEIDELRSVSCETLTAEGETVKLSSEETDKHRRYRIVLETNGVPVYLGYSMVWETR